MKTTLLMLGLFCIIAAIVRGGLRVFDWEMPVINSIKRQLILALFGVILLGAGYPVTPDILPTECATAPPLKLNEICAEGKDCDGQKDFVEIYNQNNSSVDLTCYALVDMKQHSHILSGKLGPREVSAWTDDDLQFGWSKDKDKVSLIRRLHGDLADDSRPIDRSRAYQQRIRDGGDGWQEMTHEEVKAAGNVGSRNSPNSPEPKVH